jgi:5-formyltetrahydrofolate cyclo-ligase
MEEKALLRKQFLSLRSQIPPLEIQKTDTEILNAILASPLYKNASVVLLYSAVRHEIDFSPLFQDGILNGKRMAYPRCLVNRTMLFCPVTHPEQLQMDMHTIPAPIHSLSGLTESALTGALCLVPALAVDKEGYRLGYGGGYYDVFLSQNQVISLCAVRKAFFVPSLPREKTDIPCQWICTEEGVIPCE